MRTAILFLLVLAASAAEMSHVALKVLQDDGTTVWRTGWWDQDLHTLYPSKCIVVNPQTGKGKFVADGDPIVVPDDHIKQGDMHGIDPRLAPLPDSVRQAHDKLLAKTKP